ncbi:MAG: CarD family transcriptional regulator [Oscillospiraceae bacterium]
MYQIGELIVYGATGVCRVTEIVAKKFSRTDPEKIYYILTPLYQAGTITTPIENGKVFTRPVISRDEAISLIDEIPHIQAEAYHNPNLQQLENHYKEALESHDCLDLLRLTMSTYQKKREREEAKLKFGAVDRRYMERAENLLFGELAVALDIERENVQAFIESRLQRRTNSATT